MTNQDLEVSELRYRRLFETAQDGILILDAATGRIEDVNPFLIRMLGYSRAEFVEKKLWEVGSFRDIQASQAAFEALQENEYIRYDNLPLKTKDGRLIQVEFVSNVYLVNDKKVIQCNIREITARLVAETAVLKSEERLRNTLRNMMEGCQILDHDWRFIYVNDVAAKQARKAPVEMLMHNLQETYPGIEETELFRSMRIAMEERILQRIETQFFFTDGTFGWFELSIQPVPEGIFILSIDITARKQVDEALRLNEEKYRLIIETASEGIWVIGADTRTTLVNRRLAQLLGYSAQEIMSRSFFDFIDEEQQVAAAAGLERRERGIHEQLDFKFRRKDGSALWALMETSSLQDPAGNYMGMLAMLTDITERKQAEEALRESEARYRSIFENSQDAVLLTLPDGSILDANPATCLMFNRTAGEIMRIGRAGLVDGSDPRLATAIRERDRTGKVSAELSMVRADGSKFPAEITSTSYPDAQGRIRTSMLIRDLTSRKQAEQALRESEKRFRVLIENSTDAITLLDANGTAIYDSPAAPGMLGYSAEDMLGRDVFELVHADDLPPVRNLFRKLTQEQGARADSTFRVRHKSGLWVWIETIATNLLAEPGVNAIVLNYRDVTTRKQADEKLRNAREFLQSVQDALSAHIAILDHAGNIVQVNSAWRIFGAQNGLEQADDCVGMNYLKVCDAAEGAQAAEAALVARAIREVRAGKKTEIQIPYPCHGPGQVRWFMARITSFKNNGSNWIVVAHENITERQQAETDIRQRLSELEVLHQSGLAFSQLLVPKEIAEKIIDLLDQEMAWHHTAIRLTDPANETLALLAYHLPHLNSRKVGGTPEERRAAEERFKTIQGTDQGLSGWVVRHGQAVLCNDLKNDPRYFETFPGLKSGLYVPIKTGGRVLGVISIESKQANAFSESDARLAVTLATQAAIAINNAQLLENLKNSNTDLALAYDATIEGWSRALDLRDKETEGHSQRVTDMTVRLARSMGLSEAILVDVRRGALLHDIGKMGVADGILLKPGPLTDEEWVMMKQHPSFAHAMLAPIRYLQPALDIPYCHHEKWDGSGYPRGLKGEQIPLVARIFAVVDVWDALRSERPYRAAWSRAKVKRYILSLSGTHFDPQVVAGFMRMSRKTPDAL